MGCCNARETGNLEMEELFADDLRKRNVDDDSTKNTNKNFNLGDISNYEKNISETHTHITERIMKESQPSQTHQKHEIAKPIIDIKTPKAVINNETPSEANKNKDFLSMNEDLKKKKEQLLKKLQDDKLANRYEEVNFPSIKDRISRVQDHFLGQSMRNIAYQTDKSEAEEIMDQVLKSKPVVQKKSKSKPKLAEFKE